MSIMLAASTEISRTTWLSDKVRKELRLNSFTRSRERPLPKMSQVPRAPSISDHHCLASFTVSPPYSFSRPIQSHKVEQDQVRTYTGVTCVAVWREWRPRLA